MESAFTWIGELISWIGRWIPRLVIIRSTHAGVKFVRGSIEKAVKPGICFYWPLLTELEVVAVVRQTHNLITQTLVTKDGKTVVCSIVLVYKISDVIKALCRTYDIEDAITDIAQTSLSDIIIKHDYSDLVANLNNRIQDEVTLQAKQKLQKFGVTVQSVGFTDFSPCRAINLSGVSG